MFCNQCGKENKEGIKFCVYCGNQLQNQFQAASVIYPYKNNSKKKVFIMMLAILILFFIASINVFRVYSSVNDIKIYDEGLSVNNSKYDNTFIYETGSYIYYIDFEDFGLCRMNKRTKITEQISSSIISVIAVADNGIYYEESTGNENDCYRILDKASEFEKVPYIPSSTDIVLINGKYNYTLSDGGVLTKRLNSEKYSERSIEIDIGSRGDEIYKAKIYKNYIYATITDNSLNSDKKYYKLIRISLVDGKQEKLIDGGVRDFLFMEDQIIYQDSEYRSFTISLDGKSRRELTQIDRQSYSVFACNNDIYYKVDSKLYRYDMNGGGVEEINIKKYFGSIQGLSNGLASAYKNKLYLLDYDGNVTDEIGA
jgi:hypothetical protein